MLASEGVAEVSGLAVNELSEGSLISFCSSVLCELGSVLTGSELITSSGKLSVALAFSSILFSAKSALSDSSIVSFTLLSEDEAI